jgi:hypothetical protein
MTHKYDISSREDTTALALRVVGWIVSDERRAERMLSLTGLTPDSLRAGLGKPGILAALLDFVLDHEPDLFACAEALDVKPAAIAAARAEILR